MRSFTFLSSPLSPPCFRKEILFSTGMLSTLGVWGSPDSEIPVSQSHLKLRTGVHFQTPTLSPSHRSPGQRGRESGPVLSIPGSRIHTWPPLLFLQYPNTVLLPPLNLCVVTISLFSFAFLICLVILPAWKLI